MIATATPAIASAPTALRTLQGSSSCSSSVSGLNRSRCVRSEKISPPT